MEMDQDLLTNNRQNKTKQKKQEETIEMVLLTYY